MKGRTLFAPAMLVAALLPSAWAAPPTANSGESMPAQTEMGGETVKDDASTVTENAATAQAIQAKVDKIHTEQAATIPAPTVSVRPTATTAPDGRLSAEQRTLLAKLRSQGDTPELHNEIWLSTRMGVWW